MPDYPFDINNFNTVVREIFYHFTNQSTGFDPEQHEDLSDLGLSVEEQVEVFEQSQKIGVQVRQLCQKAYRAEIQKQKPKKKKKVIAPLSYYALVIYERYVVQQMELARAMRLTSGKHSEYARQLFEKLEGET